MKIIHCLRAPVGGLFRHVNDLARMQVAAGHEVGIICDSSSGGEMAVSTLRGLEQVCQLGVRRTPMSRSVGFRDISAQMSVRNMVAQIKPDILHGHGAKGGAYARFCKSSASKPKIFYTPHGGSLHYSANSMKGRFYLSAEKRLENKTDAIIFESQYSANEYARKVGKPSCAFRVIHNGIMENEVYDRSIDPNAADFIFIGELRFLKGVDLLIHALGRLPEKWHISANIIGAGPDAMAFKKMSSRMGLDKQVHFLGAMPARKGFALGQCLIVPSRSESLPYIILEAAAANVPLILTDVGGIGEITDTTSMQLIKPNNVDELHDNLVSFLSAPNHFFERSKELQTRIKSAFTADLMATRVLEFYKDMLGE